LAWLSAATAYLNDKVCSLRQKQYSFVEKREILFLVFLSPSRCFKCKMLLSWMLSYFLNKYAPKEKVLSHLLFQNTAEETNYREDEIGMKYLLLSDSFFLYFFSPFSDDPLVLYVKKIV